MIHKAHQQLRHVRTKLALLSVELVVLLVCCFTALLVFLLLAKSVLFDQRNRIDDAAFRFLQAHVSNSNSSLMSFFSFFGSHTFLIPANVVLVLYFLVVKKNVWNSIKIPAISLSTVSLMYFLKNLFHRQRPVSPLLEAARGLSFPSGHALSSATFYGMFIYLIWKTTWKTTIKILLTIALVLLILLVGISRIYLRVHYATDVLAGFSLGFIWLVLSVFLLNRVEQVSRKSISQSLQQ